MSEEKSLGSLIRQAREAVGWTQQAVADKLDPPANRVTVNRWEQDIQRISVRYLKQIIDALNLNEKEVYALYYAGGKTPPERENLPLPNRFFTGRENEFQQLGELLKKHSIVAIHGLGGIGKTQIALTYAHRLHPGVYPTVLWVNAADTATLQTNFASLAETLGLPERNKQELELRVKAVKQWLEDYTNWLLIMDNADELPIVEPFLLSRPHGHIILTTRWQFPGKLAKPLAVAAMDTEEGRHFLLQRTDRSPKGAELGAIDQLVAVLGGHALALEQAGAFIQETGSSFVNYLRLYEGNRRSLLEQYGSLNDEYSEHPLTVAATFKTSFARVREMTSLAEEILHFCAFLQPDAIPEELFQSDDTFKLDPMEFEKGIAALQRYSLMKLNEQERTFSMHRLVQAVLVDDMLPDLQKQWRERAARAVNAAFPDQFDYVYYKLCNLLLPHVLGCADWTKDELTPTVEFAKLFHRAGCYQYGQMRYAVAEPLLLRAISIYEQHFGAEHSRTLSALINLASTYLENDQYSQAERVYRQALTVSEKLLGTEDFYTAIILQGLTAINICQGKHEQNEPLFDRINHILFIVEQDFAAEQLPTASVFKIYKALSCSQGRYEQAEFLHRYMSSVTESSD